MKVTSRARAIIAGLFLTTAASYAHPGSAGHYHPDEVDEFDQAAMTAKPHEFDFGGILVLTGIAGCLGFAFLQKQGGIWKDATADH